MKKMILSLILMPFVTSGFCYAATVHFEKNENIKIKRLEPSAGERALEERPFYPKPKKCNDPVTGSDGSDPEPEVNLDR